MLRKSDVATLGNGSVLYLRGTPYEQGRQLGAGAADLIAENVERAQALVQRVATGFDVSSYRAMTRRNEAWVSRNYPELLDEIHGIADGSGIDYFDLVHLNLNTDVAYARAYAMVHDCTQVLATGPATLDGKTYLAKTRDLTRGPTRQVLLHREYDDGTFRNEIQSAGQMTLPVGVNQHGVAVGTSGQWSSRVVVDLARGDSAWHIPNLQLVLRYAHSAEEGVQIVRDQPRVAGMNMLIDDERTACALEITDSHVEVFEPDDGILVRTNHYLSPALAHLAPTPSENPGTFERYARASEMAVARHGQLGTEDMLAILSDHAEDGRESICRHANGVEGVGQTYAAMVICPQDRQVWALFGNPCEGIQAVGRPTD
jgi:isopenicillin-N N-acyltransferase like protein